MLYDHAHKGFFTGLKRIGLDGDPVSEHLVGIDVYCELDPGALEIPEEDPSCFPEEISQKG